MDEVDERAERLVIALAELAGRRIDRREATVVVGHSRALSAARANEIWSRHRRAPSTVSLRDYLAMTLRFVERASSG